MTQKNIRIIVDFFRKNYYTINRKNNMKGRNDTMTLDNFFHANEGSEELKKQRGKRKKFKPEDIKTIKHQIRELKKQKKERRKKEYIDTRTAVRMLYDDILWARHEGFSYAEIASAIGVSADTLARYLREIEAEKEEEIYEEKL
jgi:DNA invertase Pin-like site-specific DNA recombinase